MNLDDLKGKELDDERFGKLKDYVDSLTGQRDAARKESIEGRKKLKAEHDAAIARVAELEDWAGLEAGADLTAMPPPKGSAEAVKQYEAKLKRAEREREEAIKSRDEIASKHRSSVQRIAINEALNGHEFTDRDVAETYISRFVTWENDELVFKAEDGRLLPLKDGVAGVVKAKPALLKSQGAGGAGFRPSNAGSGGSDKTMTRAEWDAADHGARRDFAKSGGKVVDAA